MCKLFHNLTDFLVAAYLKPNNEKRTHGSHAFKFVVPRAKKDIFKFSFFPRTISECNSLPEDIVNTTSVDSFKSRLVNSFQFFHCTSLNQIFIIFQYSIVLVIILIFTLGVISRHFYRLNKV